MRRYCPGHGRHDGRQGPSGAVVGTPCGVTAGKSPGRPGWDISEHFCLHLLLGDELQRFLLPFFLGKKHGWNPLSINQCRVFGSFWGWWNGWNRIPKTFGWIRNGEFRRTTVTHHIKEISQLGMVELVKRHFLDGRIWEIITTWLGDQVPHMPMTGSWFGTWILFSHIFGKIIPIDFHIFQRGRYTTNQMIYHDG